MKHTKSAAGIVRRAFSLVEVTLALGVAAFTLLAIFGLLPIALQNNQAAVEQTAANGILSAVTADLRGTCPTYPPGQSAISEQYTIPIPANPIATTPGTTRRFVNSEGKVATTLQPDSRFILSVNFLPNTNAKAATMANLQVCWPATPPVVADPKKAVGSLQVFVALERN